MPYIENLEPFDIFRLSFGLVFTITSIIIGTLMIIKYFSVKQKNLILVGITWIGLSSPWLPDTINLILIALTEFYLPEIIYLTLTIALIPFPLCCWLAAFFDFLAIKRRNMILVIAVILSVLFEIFFFSLLILDYRAYIGTAYTNGEITIQSYTLFTQVYFIIVLSAFILTGLVFGFQAIKSGNAEVKMKGKFLVAAFIILLISTLTEIIIGDPILIVIILRGTGRTISGFLFYLGFILPKGLKKRLL
ncbi:MAG: hypothetical protein GF383_10295 [Candidatus Lokiarchaeota archaeon]|nr:hypothetical protein [Candidatus Lokiarchaeota archaeon]MBD3340946.1 hypothetical protein [Candidatus Lokiarchaeota archaeon]